VKSNHCDTNPSIVSFPEKTQRDKSRVQLAYYRSRQSNDVAFYTVLGGGHAWPGAARTSSPNGNVNEDIDATQVIWDFFKAHPKQLQDSPAPFRQSS
jgi:polyhydroxybutyrate depolymerase